VIGDSNVIFDLKQSEKHIAIKDIPISSSFQDALFKSSYRHQNAIVLRGCIHFLSLFSQCRFEDETTAQFTRTRKIMQMLREHNAILIAHRIK